MDVRNPRVNVSLPPSLADSCLKDSADRRASREGRKCLGMGTLRRTARQHCVGRQAVGRPGVLNTLLCREACEARQCSWSAYRGAPAVEIATARPGNAEAPPLLIGESACACGVDGSTCDHCSAGPPAAVPWRSAHAAEWSLEPSDRARPRGAGLNDPRSASMFCVASGARDSSCRRSARPSWKCGAVGGGGRLMPWKPEDTSPREARRRRSISAQQRQYFGGLGNHLQ